MKNNHTVETIQNDLREISDVVDSFKNSENIRAIDIDIVISKVQNLYDLLLLIKKTSNENIESLKNIPDTTPQAEKKVAPTVEEPVQQVQENVQVDPVQKEEDQAVIQEQQEETVIEIEREEKAPEIIADKYQAKEHSLNESLGQSITKQDLSTKIQSKPIKDLSASIGVNDKFLFQKVLFKGDKIRYTETIDKLNETTNFDEALAYIQSNFDWAPNNEAADKLLELVRRKFW